MAVLDHLVYATSDLDTAVRSFAAATGVSPEPGGVHPGLGTRNAQVALGGSYLELIGPDPAQPEPAGGRPLGVGSVEGFVAFAVRPATGETIDDLVGRAHRAGFDLGPVVDMSRQRPDGVELRWRLTMPRLDVGAAVPFVIDWGDTPQPSDTVGARGELHGWTLYDPEPDRVRGLHDALGLELTLEAAAVSRLDASIAGPTGRFPT